MYISTSRFILSPFALQQIITPSCLNQWFQIWFQTVYIKRVAVKVCRWNIKTFSFTICSSLRGPQHWLCGDFFFFSPFMIHLFSMMVLWPRCSQNPLSTAEAFEALCLLLAAPSCWRTMTVFVQQTYITD